MVEPGERREYGKTEMTVEPGNELFKGLPDFKETRLKLVTLNDPDELFQTLDYIAGRWGGYEAPEAGNVYNV